MQDTIPIPACFSSGEKAMDNQAAAATKSVAAQSVVMSIYRTKITGQCRLITITWCKNLLVHGLSVSIEGSVRDDQYTCKVELKPWYFWRKQGSKRFQVDAKVVDIFWDLKAAKFSSEPEPRSDYYVAIVSDEEVVLLLGDLKKEAYRKTGSRPSLIDPILVSKKEHVYGKKRFSTRAKFNEKGKSHEISIECSNSSSSSSSSNCSMDPEMSIKIDGHLAIQVKHLQWKFRGNGFISINRVRVEVYWDVHDWLFSPGLRHALFIFKPSSAPSSSSSSPLQPSTSSVVSTASSSSIEGSIAGGTSDFCLFLYAWKLD